MLAADDQTAIRRRKQEKEGFARKLTILFEELDQDANGCISRDELMMIGEDPLIKDYFTIFDVSVPDLVQLYDLLDDGDGRIDFNEFLKGMGSLTGQSKRVDINKVLKLSEAIDKRVHDIYNMAFSAKQVSAVSCDAKQDELRQTSGGDPETPLPDDLQLPLDIPSEQRVRNEFGGSGDPLPSLNDSSPRVFKRKTLMCGEPMRSMSTRLVGECETERPGNLVPVQQGPLAPQTEVLIVR
eukprot:gnl/TRDRNA2_/TRDRNA2_176732_c4_seq2.p1 gnl/TRDRNA2_/TRDRNA2_176732_c4~~gnl/TRDRNA2_/TRDRNA2_176732_c4_seq2.p1  ORF type:complete len:268 (+),score=49.36 gnl/TRDRNA2_/TRDRNA2_176732_c4_seq2:85-804(+)